MVNPWALTLPLILVVVVAYRWSASDRAADTVYVANTRPGRLLPRYRRRISQLRFASAAALVVLTAVSIAGAVLVARPHSVEVRDENLASRDLVICLDVSGSVIAYDSEIMEELADMIPSFQGERIGLVIWNSDSQVVFPLTSDYGLAERRLLDGARALETDSWSDYPKNPDDFYSFTAGTYLESTGGASLVGDGLVNCAMQFDQPEDDRSRTIILATDNDVSIPSAQVYSLSDAVEFASERGITIHGMYIETFYGADNVEAREMRTEIEGAGGSYSVAGDPDAAGRLVDDIEEQQASELSSDPVTIIVDSPGFWPLVAAAGISLLIVMGWRYRL